MELYRNPEQYKAQKERVAQEVIHQLAKRFEGLDRQIEVVDVATPATTTAYTGNGRGFHFSLFRMVLGLFCGAPTKPNAARPAEFLHGWPMGWSSRRSPRCSDGTRPGEGYMRVGRAALHQSAGGNDQGRPSLAVKAGSVRCIVADD
jgi:phytoene dehydrogenase-like protein